MQVSKKKFKVAAIAASAFGLVAGYIGGNLTGSDSVRDKYSEDFKCVAGGDLYGGERGDLVFVLQPEGASKFLMFATAPIGRISTDKVNIEAPDLKGDFVAYVDYTRPSLGGAAPLGYISIDRKAGKCELTVAMTGDAAQYMARAYRLQGVVALNK